MTRDGEIIGERWRIERKLGEGGFATVYAATVLGSSERVAIKLLRQRDGGGYDPETARRYAREIEILATLCCEHTVRSIAHGNTSDGTLFLVFEHIDGEELADLLARRGRLATHEIVHILGQLLESLDEAHRQGLLHRDLKPHNILVYERDGDRMAVKLIDFGIARSIDPNAPTVTQTGALVGTPKYMSPEQLLKAPLSPASDLYSLGLIAFEMALGRDALHGSSIGDQIDRLRSGHLFSVPELDQLGARLHQTISRMCARAPEDRFQSAHSVLVALDLGPKSPVVQARMQSDRRIWVAGAIAVVVIGALLVTFLAKDQPPPQVRHTSKLATASEIGPPAEPVTATREPIRIPPREMKPWYSEGCRQPSDDEPSDALKLPTVDRTTAVPLVVLFHDAGVDHIEFLRGSGFEKLSEDHRFAVLTVAGKAVKDERRDPWRESAWKTPVRDALATIEQTLDARCIDTRRIYAVGHGSGGKGAEEAACRATLFAATATVGWRGHKLRGLCDRDFGKHSRLRFNGIDNRHEPLFGERACGGDVHDATLDGVEEALAEALSCETDDRPFHKQNRRQKRVWECPNGKLESHVTPGGRAWAGVPYSPASDPNGCNGPAPDVAFAEEIWAFFERDHARGRPSRGCGNDNVTTGRGILVGTQRHVGYIPSRYDPNRPHPLVVLVHDDNELAEAFLEQTKFEEIAERKNFIVVAPQGNRVHTWKGGNHRVIRSTFEAVSDTLCVDLDRVIAVGDSRGGVALDAMACEDWYTGLATNAHVPYIDVERSNEKLRLHLGQGLVDCTTRRPRPTVNVRAGFQYTPGCDTPESVELWRGAMNEHAAFLGATNPDVSATTANRCRTAVGGRTPFASCLFEGSVWRGPAKNYDCEYGPETHVAAEHIWKFFDELDPSVWERPEDEVDGD